MRAHTSMPQRPRHAAADRTKVGASQERDVLQALGTAAETAIRHRRGLRAVLAAATCAGAGAASVLAATPAHATGEPVFESDLYTVITGVVRADGNAVAGADVVLLAWPNDDVLDELNEGGPGPQPDRWPSYDR